MSAALSTHFSHDELLPRATGSLGPGAVLAVVAHVGLVWALTTSTQWRTHTPEVISAELWGAIPQQAAPRPQPPAPPPPPTQPAPEPTPPLPVKPQAAPPPPPPPEPTRDADIAIEQARLAEAARKLEALERAKAEAEAERKRAEAKLKRDAELAKKREDETKRKREAEAQAQAKKAELEKRQRAEQERKALAKAKAEDERLDKQREENLRRMVGQAERAAPASVEGTGGAGTAAVSRAPSVAYVGRLIALIKPNIVFTGQVAGNPAAEVEVRAAPDGSIISRKLVKTSGHRDWDEAVLRAIDKTAALPLDTDGRVPSGLILVFRPGG